ncbi:hypothetical protein [Micromonospora sp. NPDC000442]|uniref:hypothetical protein n=1 Tax=Micromonospora sp. NPDC000442 TaxID=3364217 RepID=UPI00367CC0C3
MQDVVRDVVVEVAPEELPLVAGLARFDEATVVRRLGRWGGRREPLGFGAGEAAALVTAVVWLAVDQSVRRLGDAATDSLLWRMKALLRRLFRRRAEPATVPALTPEQLGEVRRRVLEVAAQRGLERDRADTIADAVVARLVLGTSDERDRPEGESAAGTPTVRGPEGLSGQRDTRETGGSAEADQNRTRP